MNIKVLTESVSGLGLGHVVRSFNLSVQFLDMGYEVEFFVRGNGDFNSFLSTQLEEQKLEGFYPIALEWDKLKSPEILRSDICIIDSYEVSDFSFILEFCRVVVIFDDENKRFELLKKCLDSKKNVFLLNPNGYYADIKSDLLSRIFSGLAYAPLNKCFLDKNLKGLERNIDYLVCFGGEDSHDKSSEALDFFKDSGLNVNIIIGANYSGKLLDSKYLKNHESNIRIFRNITQVKLAKMLASSKNCIISGGGIIFEAVRLCQNVFVLSLADNQNIQTDLLVKQGLVQKIKNISDIDSIKKISHTDRDIIENISLGMGDMIANLAMEAINQTISTRKKHKNFKLRSLEAINFCNLDSKDILRVLEYRNHSLTREYMYANDIISAKSHIEFVESLKEQDQSKYFLVRRNNDDIGVISLTRINMKHRHGYLGMYKNPLLESVSHKTSHGSMLMDMIKHIAFKEYGLHMLYLEVVARNIKAIRFYEKEGFMFLGELLDGFKKNNNYCNVLIYGFKSSVD